MVKAIKRSLFSSFFVLLVLPYLINLYSSCKFAYALDTLLPGQFLNANQSQILISKNGAFKLGFDFGFSGDNYPPYCYLGIWFAKSSSCHREHPNPIWRPVQYSGDTSCTLSLSENGVLNLSTDGYSYWSSPYISTTSVHVVAVLLDNGNLVIRDQVNNSMVIWQSFDNPTDVLLSGGHLGFNKITGKNVTLLSHSDYFDTYLSLDATRRRGFIIQHNSYGPMLTGTFPRWMDIREDGQYALTFNNADTYIRLNSSGFVIFSKQGECDTVLWSFPDTLCDYDSYCGPYSLCTRSGSCICPVGFDPPSANAWTTTGCWRKVPLDCENVVTESEVSFHPIDGIHRYPQNAWTSEIRSMRECESSCFRDCTCIAFAYNTTCLLWFRELRNTVVLDSGSNGNRLYIRISTKQQQLDPRASPLFSFRKKLIVLSVFSVLALVICLILLWRCRTKLSKAITMDVKGSLMVFSFVQIKNSTKNFSEKLGEGGFGCVFKGTLPAFTAVAVKRLKGLGQGDKQFRAEVQTIGLIQHTNLVRLLGFCADEHRRLLVYEYMVNGSLNSHLFSGSSAKLSWELRYHVALGTARGLAYLHEECKDCIVHCDLKPDNILLDQHFCPKIADFGMAKLLGRDFSRVLTTMRGTIGYLAPEWISGVPITHKADVYSYGMMLLEIISGRRNSDKIKEGKFTYFPIYAAIKVNEGGDVMCLLDTSLEGNADADQLSRACRVACWCIQDAEDHRPMMSEVVRMLEGVMDVEVPPVPRSLQNYVGMEEYSSADLGSF